MITLLLTALATFVFAYFAAQNTHYISVSVLGEMLQIPTYVLALGATMFGLLIGFIMSAIDGISAGLTLYDKNRTLARMARNSEMWRQRVAELEAENRHLKADNRNVRVENLKQRFIPHTSWWNRLRHSF